MDIGFLGLGQMGAAIAERLQEAGHQLHVHDPNAAAMAPFVARGAVAHLSPAAVADAAPLVFACLPNGAVSQAVARQVAEGSAVRTYVEMSTIGSKALEQVRHFLPPEDEREWCRRFRLVRLVDHADFWLSRTRSARWLREYVDGATQFPLRDRAAVGIFFHWCAGMWGVRALRANGPRDRRSFKSNPRSPMPWRWITSGHLPPAS